ncbi:hypothetical protein J7E88_11410 [Streptomyces sp. ISL-10]|uniref:hypothetical protein n=1 Tax=Streptomyces sp. ISL-10 TaxID=2819172 RepID=UPI001BE7FA3A|nr:hypothetical protein [Streptomyces sp. ISL-10]MBT2365896.1 hypothetical protein [Streptomyces sp. ISL-10]
MSDIPTARFRITAAALAMSAAAVTLNAAAVTTAAAATAGRCSQAAPTRADNPYTTTHTALRDASPRMGPYGECYRLKTYAQGATVEVRCFIVNEYGNTWSYVPGAGWVWDEHLSGNGSPQAACSDPTP